MRLSGDRGQFHRLQQHVRRYGTTPPFPNSGSTATTSFGAATTHGYRVATRWSLVGTHTGYGVYGEPTGERVQIMGISHHLVRGGRFIKEWTVFDELALLKQLLKADVARPEG